MRARARKIVPRHLRLQRWLWLPLIIATAVLAHQYTSGAYATEQRERSENDVYLELQGVSQFENYVVSLVAAEPSQLAAQRPVVLSLARTLSVGLVTLHGLARANDEELARSAPLARLNASYQRAVSTAFTQPAQARPSTSASSVSSTYTRWNSALTRAGAANVAAANSEGSTAKLSSWLGYGIATLVIVLILMRVAYVQRRSVRKRGEAALAVARREFQTIIDGSSSPIFMCDTDSRYVLTNHAFESFVGVGSGEAIGKHHQDVLPEQLHGGLGATNQRVLEGETVSEELVVTMAGGNRIVSALKFPLADAAGRTYGLCGIVTDITERRQMELEIERLAAQDPLTGLFNRRRLMREVQEQLRRCRTHRSPGALLVLDIDNFKVVNDSYGHAAGDQQLIEVAHVLQNRVRAFDTVARLGSDEFVVVLSSVTEQQALTVAAGLQALLQERQMGPPIPVSIGICTFEPHTEVGTDDLLVHADVALYEAKEAGGERIKVYRGDPGAALTWVQRIRTALEQDLFVLYEQPILELATGRVTAYELLIRMLAEDGDVIPPAAFIPTAERFGMIGGIDAWVTRQAIKLGCSGKSVSVNLSAHSLGDPTIIAAVRAAVADGLDPAKLIFEITETAALTNTAEARLLAASLSAIGCELALDDFGTGFGAFSYLKHLPADYLKIDREFVAGATEDPTDEQIVSSICGIAHALGKRTIAEGVETEETLEAMRRLGVDFAQGYLIGRPAPVEIPVTVG